MFYKNQFVTYMQYTLFMLIFFSHIFLSAVQLIFFKKFNFLSLYYKRSENLWNDGFLFDFLQKKTIDSWVRQYIIFTGFLFSERVVFEAVIRLYNDLVVWPFHNWSIFETTNTSSMLNMIIFFYFSLFIMLIILVSVLV